MLNFTEYALSTMGYLILRLAYINAVEDRSDCDSVSENLCDFATLFEDTHGEVENFLTALEKEPYTRERARFFELLTEEMAEGVYFDSERLEEKGIAKKDQPEYFWKSLSEFINARSTSPLTETSFRIAFEKAVEQTAEVD